MNNRAAIVIEGWKLPIFERHLSQAGYALEISKGLITDNLVITVETDNFEALGNVVEAANAEAARTGAQQH